MDNRRRDPSQCVRQIYRMAHHKGGKAILINNRKFSPNIGLQSRDFSDRDAAKLYVQLINLGFDIEMHENLKGDQIDRLFYKASQHNYSGVDCFLCIVLSYGDQGVVYGTDRHVYTENLLTWFSGRNCQSLAGKPKIFIFQACDPSLYHSQGLMEADSGHSHSRTSKRGHRLPSEADFLMLWSTIPGALSWRDPCTDGSIFIEALCAELALLSQKSSNNLEITRMLTRVVRRVAYELESNAPLEFKESENKLPVVVSMLTKELYLKPLERQTLNTGRGEDEVDKEEGYAV